jgi:hypothetical protein
MENLVRYDLDKCSLTDGKWSCSACMRACLDGDYVKYEDVEKLIVKLMTEIVNLKMGNKHGN